MPEIQSWQEVESEVSRRCSLEEGLRTEKPLRKGGFGCVARMLHWCSGLLRPVVH